MVQDSTTEIKKYPLEGMTFVFTGDLSIDRDDAKGKVIMLGGRVTVLPSSKTTYLVVGNQPGPSKMSKAKDLQLKTLNETQFLNLIEDSFKNFHDTMIVNVTDEEIGKNDMCTPKVEDLWTEKWRPTNIKDIVGNQAIVNQLRDYLSGKTAYKAALLSGVPGIGKTTLAYIVAKELNYKVIEFNASDTRNKGELDKRIKGVLNYHSISIDLKLEKKILLMDEIDGMTSDRGGIAELTSIIKKSKIPIICICNDRYHVKIRTLTNYCYDLKLRKLESRQIIPRVKYILAEEKKQIPDTLLNEVIATANGDIGYILNTLQNLVVRKTASYQQTSGFIKKNSIRSIFDLSTEMFQRRKISDKIDVYFEEYSLIPLMVQENYLKLTFKTTKDLHCSADSVSMADLFDTKIHGPNQMWGLLPIHGFFSCILPAKEKFLTKRIDFPLYLGQNSKRLKHKRSLLQIFKHTHRIFRANPLEIRMYYLYSLYKKYTHMFSENKIDECIEILNEYCLLKEDMDLITEIIINGQVALKGIPAKNKSALTRAYKKLVRTLPYSVDEEIKNDVDDEIEDEMDIEEKSML